LFRRWQRAGVWALILAGLQTRADAAGLITWEVSVETGRTSTPQVPASRVSRRKNHDQAALGHRARPETTVVAGDRRSTW
jgi:hypothetical protein